MSAVSLITSLVNHSIEVSYKTLLHQQPANAFKQLNFFVFNLIFLFLAGGFVCHKLFHSM